MKTDFLLAITQLAAERNLPKDIVFGAVEAALVTAFKKDEEGARQDISVKIHPVSGDVKVYTTKTVVETPTDSYQEMSLAEAKKFKKDAELGERLSFETTSFHSGRIAAQTAKQELPFSKMETTSSKDKCKCHDGKIDESRRSAIGIIPERNRDQLH